MTTHRCHTCNSGLVICTDVFARHYCYEHARKWIEHIGAVVGCGDVSRWCEHGGLAGPVATVVTDEERTDSAAAEAVAQDQAADAGSGTRLMEGTTMLVLSRRKGEQIVIGDDVVVEVTRIKGSVVQLAVHAPKDVRILRSELERHDDTNTTLP